VREYLLKTSQNPLLKSANFQNLRTDLLETALPYYEDFVQQSQSDSRLEAERGGVYQEIGALRRELGDLSLALEELAKAKEIFQRLTRTIPDEPEYAHELAGTLINRGVLLQELGQFDEAESAFLEALKILEPLGPKYRSTVAQVVSSLGELLRQLKDRRSDSEEMLRRAITIREQLLGEHPDDLELRRQLATTWLNIGSLYHADHRADDAKKTFEHVLELLSTDLAQNLPGDSDQSVRFRQLRASAFNNLGIIHVEAERFGDAEKAYGQALAIKESLVETFPSVAQYRHELAGAHNNLGTWMHSLNRPAEAQRSFEEAVRIYERLIADVDDVPLYKVGLAGTYINLGRHMGDEGELEGDKDELEESLTPLTKGIDILESIHRQEPRTAKVRDSLVRARWARAMTLCGLQRFSEGAEDWSRAIELDDGFYHNELRIRRMSCYLCLQDHARAYTDALAVADSDEPTKDDLYNAAAAFALCAGLVADEPSLREQYAAGAVKALRQARDKGYNDLERLKSHSDFDALRSREDFQDLLRQMESGTDKQDEGKPEP
jgi:tetratricopeptide (TPR) repeat protein